MPRPAKVAGALPSVVELHGRVCGRLWHTAARPTDSSGYVSPPHASSRNNNNRTQRITLASRPTDTRARASTDPQPPPRPGPSLRCSTLSTVHCPLTHFTGVLARTVTLTFMFMFMFMFRRAILQIQHSRHGQTPLGSQLLRFTHVTFNEKGDACAACDQVGWTQPNPTHLKPLHLLMLTTARSQLVDWSHSVALTLCVVHPCVRLQLGNLFIFNLEEATFTLAHRVELPCTAICFHNDTLLIGVADNSFRSYHRESACLGCPVSTHPHAHPSPASLSSSCLDGGCALHPIGCRSQGTRLILMRDGIGSPAYSLTHARV